ncbi:MAG TPA: hypothetical protein VLA00_11770 [Xanthobacteraceae bacterium]|nr:hypothetical protein [Xanthobacteraceae bacterium]
MHRLVLRGAAIGLALCALWAAPAAIAAPAGPANMTTVPAVGTPAVDIASRRGWQPRRGPSRGWHGPRMGPRYGWNGPRGRYGYGPRFRPYRYGYYNRPNWGWGFAAPFIAAPFLAAPYYWNDDCGYVSVRRWFNGRRVWVRQYQCF